MQNKTEEKLDIVASFNHSKAGNFMFKLCAKWTKFLVKHKWLYYLLACTWGSLLTIIGCILTIGLAFGKLFTKNIRFKKYNWVYGVLVGPEYWGGFEMGLMYVRDQKSAARVDYHEFGHTFQNCLFGPFTPFIVSLPSAIRYWVQTIRRNKGKSNPPYDSAWFEDSATLCGDYANKFLSKDKAESK